MPSEVLDPATEDATRSFGQLVADAFQADHQLLAWSGATQSDEPSNYTAATAATPTIPQLFGEEIAGDKSSTNVNFSAWEPQASTERAAQGNQCCGMSSQLNC